MDRFFNAFQGTYFTGKMRSIFFFPYVYGCNMSVFERAFEEKKLGRSGLLLKNVFIRSAAYEGMLTDGLPNQDLTNHHVDMARGSVALTTVSYGAVSSDGRTFNSQMYIHEQSLARLKELADAVHTAGGKVSMQLTHCGYFSKNRDIRRPLAPSRVFNAYGFLSGIAFSRAMNREDMQRIAGDFARAASRLKEIGFDAVEIHMGHGYLLSQFLSPRTNKRKDAYGGPIENRARFPLEVVEAVRTLLGKTFPVLVKLNLSDGFRGGFSLEDCKYVSRALEEKDCTAIVLSGGFTSITPFYLMRGSVPLWGMIGNGSNLAEKITMALLGPFIIKRYKFSPNFFLKQANEIRKVVKLPLAYLGGVDSRQGIEEILDAGFDFIAMARVLIHDPEFLSKLKADLIEKTECNRCNKCVVEMDRGGLTCVLE
jgi:2,4-dienoyl-CoA reductase-like NADH-dependent reductase (Old Yellow Enzyme family)